MRFSGSIAVLALATLFVVSRALATIGPDKFVGEFHGNGAWLTNLPYSAQAKDATNAWSATNAHALGQVSAAEWARATQGVVRSSWAYVAAAATNSYYRSNNYVIASAYLSNGYAEANWTAPAGGMALPSTASSELSSDGTNWTAAAVTNGAVWWRLRTSYYGDDGWVSNIWVTSWMSPWLVGVSNEMQAQTLYLDTPTIDRHAANKSYVDTVAAGVIPAAWANYPALSDVRVPGKRVSFEDYSLLSNGSLYALSYTIESSQQWFRIQHSRQDLFRLSASNVFLCITNLRVDVSNWVNLAVATNWMETSPFPEVTTNLLGYWSTVGTYLSVTNGDSSVTLRFTNAWTGMAFFRAVCASTNPSVTEIRTDQTYLPGSLTVDGGGNVITNGGVRINGSALGNGTNLTIAGTGSGIDGATATTIVHNVTDAPMGAISNVAWWASNSVALISNTAYWASNAVPGLSNIAWWASNSIAFASNTAKWASNSVAGVSNASWWASNSVLVVSNSASWASNSFAAASNRIYAAVSNAQSGAVLPGLLRGTGTNYLFGSTNGLTVGDMLRWDGTNFVRSAAFTPRNGGYGLAGGAWDYETNNVPTNGTVYYLDLSLLTNADGSAAVPAGAKWVATAVQAQGPTANNYVSLMAVSNNAMVANIARVQIINQTWDSYAMVPILTDRVIYFYSSPAANWVRTRAKVLGYGY